MLSGDIDHHGCREALEQRYKKSRRLADHGARMADPGGEGRDPALDFTPCPARPGRVGSTCPAQRACTWPIVPSCSRRAGAWWTATSTFDGPGWDEEREGLAGSGPWLAQSEGIRPQASLDGLRVAPGSRCSGGCVVQRSRGCLTRTAGRLLTTHPCSRLFSPKWVGSRPMTRSARSAIPNITALSSEPLGHRVCRRPALVSLQEHTTLCAVHPLSALHCFWQRGPGLSTVDCRLSGTGQGQPTHDWRLRSARARPGCRDCRLPPPPIAHYVGLEAMTVSI